MLHELVLMFLIKDYIRGCFIAEIRAVQVQVRISVMKLATQRQSLATSGYEHCTALITIITFTKF